MTATKPRKRSRRTAAVAAATAATSVSWAALVAATTFGLGPVGRVRAEVKGAAGLEATVNAQPYRLVVQCYAPESVTAEGAVDSRARPLGSAQRSITAEELERGIAVDVLRVGDETANVDESVVVAWVEPGEPVLEFDALRARPSSDAVFGVGRVSATNVRVTLNRVG